MMQKDGGLEQRIRGWFPKEPTLSIIGSTSAKDEVKIDSWALTPFLVSGALIIFAALLSANFGLTLVSEYFPGALCEEGPGFYAAFHVGILSIIAFVIGLICGGLLLAGKRVQTAVTGIAVIFCLGLATIVIPIMEGSAWTNGLIVASPMIAFPIVALIQVGLNSGRLKAYNVIQEPESTIETEPKPINRKPVAAGLGAAGCGLILAGLISYNLAPVFERMVPGIIIVTGAGLIIAAYLERRAYKHCDEGNSWK